MNSKICFPIVMMLVSCSLATSADTIDRNNVASQLYGSRAGIIHADGHKTNAEKVINGNYDDGSAVKLEGVPSTLQIDFPAPTQINLIRIFPGMTIYAPNPSGDCGIKDYKIEGLNNGYWHPLAQGINQPDFIKSNAGSNAAYFYEHNFKPATVSAVRIIVTRSGATGMSVSKPGITPEAERHSYIREIEIYEAAKSSSRLSWFNQMVTGDFRLPVYRAQKTAELKLTGSPWLKPTPAILSVTAEKDGTVKEQRTATLKTGEQSVQFDLDSYPNGRFIVTIAPQDKNCPLKGDIKRMLRIDRGGNTELPQEPVVVTGQKIFPVDDFHFAELQGIVTCVKPAEVIQATKPLLAPGRAVQQSRGGASINYDTEGNFVIAFYDATRSGKDRKNHFAFSKDLKNWQIADQSPSGKPNKYVAPPLAAIPAAAVPKWAEKTKLEKSQIRFYDRERDGIAPLNEIRMQWFPPFVCDAAKYGLIKWGTYPVWEKRPGEWLVMTPKPLLVDKFEFESGELETEQDSNDNFAPQFLSDDGKTMFYNRAAKLRRFEPYTIEYDNIRQAHRILRTHYTHDGINWQRSYLTLPDENDHWSYQHYGLHSFRVDKNFYIGYLHSYHCTRQQISTEIIYSRDGLNWKRIPGSEPFVANGPIGSWRFGMIFTEGQLMERDGKFYQVLGTTYRHQHFYDSGKDDLSYLNGEFLRRSFGGRKLAEQWPFFNAIGGWDGLAKDMLDANDSVGLAVFRKDGWMAAQAEDNGTMLSRILSAGKSRLYLNACTSNNGSIKVEVLSTDGKAIDAYCGENAAVYTGDSTAAALQWSKGRITALPESPFRLRLTMNHAELYSLNFVSSSL